MAVVGFPFPGTAFAAPAAPDPTITVLVYDYTQAPPTILARAEREAGRIFGEAGLKVAWLDCTPEDYTPLPQDPCQGAIKAEDVRLRILLARVRNFLYDSAFGFAIAPALATVYYESALGFAKYDREFEAPIVLGCVIAHEIGHLLLGPNRHSVSGVMRAHWEREDIRLALMGAMLFTSEQAKLMRAEMQRRFRLQMADAFPIVHGPRQSSGIQIDPNFLQYELRKTRTTKQWFALSLFREGINSRSKFYSFLCFWKVIELAYPDPPERSKWLVSVASMRTREKLRLSQILGVTNDLETYLRNERRHAVAHVFQEKRPGSHATNRPVNPDDPTHEAIVRDDLPVIEDFARVAIEEMLASTQPSDQLPGQN